MNSLPGIGRERPGQRGRALGVSLLLGAMLMSCPLWGATAVPALSLSSFLGGGGTAYDYEEGMGIALDTNGNVYVTGTTASPGFPVTQTIGSTDAGYHLFVTKANAAGSALVYSTLIEGGFGRAIAVDAQGNAYIAGYATGPGLPTTTNAFQASYAGAYDAFVAKLSPDGARLLYCTYLGGSGLDFATAIAVDASGNACVTGWTTSTNFPVSAGALQPALAGGYDAFVVKLDPTGHARFATYLGGAGYESGASLALDPDGNIYVAGTTTSTNVIAGVSARWLGQPNARRAGRNAYVAKLDAAGTRVAYVSLLGGSADDLGAAVAVDAAGDAFLLGSTASTDFPASTNGLQPTKNGDPTTADNFLAKLDPTGTNLLYSTYLGGSQDEALTDLFYTGGFSVDGHWIPETYLQVESASVAVDSAGNAYIGARTSSPDFAPAGAPTAFNGNWDGYVAKVNPQGTALLWFAYLGASADDVVHGLALPGDGTVWVTGSTGFTYDAPHYAVTPGAFQPTYGGNAADAFVARLANPPAAPPNDNFVARPLLSGKFLTVRGDNSNGGKEPGEPAHAGDPGGASLWWSWQAPGNGRLIATTQGSGFDTLLAVYTGSNIASLLLVASNDDVSLDRTFSRVVCPVQAGALYQIAVDGKQGATGEIKLGLAFSAATNDDFAQRFTLTGFPVTTTGANLDATRELDEPLHGNFGRQSVWWSWTAPVTGDVAINTFGSDFNTLLAVYTNAPVEAFQLASNDDYSNRVSQVSVTVTKGVTYFIAVDGVFTDAGHIQLNLGPGAPPPNDDFTNATVLTGYATNLTASNLNATGEPDEPSLLFTNATGVYGNAAHQTVWWTWTAPTNGYLYLSTAGSDFDTRLFLFTGTALTNLVLIGGNDDWQDLTSRVYVPVQAGVTYYVQVDGSRYNSTGTIQLGLRLTQPPTILAASLVMPLGGPLQVQVQGVPGRTYQVQVTTNLTTWEVVAGGPFTGAPFTFTDPTAAGATHKFYRAVEVP